MCAGTHIKIWRIILTLILITSVPTFAGKIICVDDDGPADFSNIQAAIDDANDGDIIIVNPGTYIENINLNGKSITLTSTDPCSPDVVAATIIDGNQNGSVVTFNSGEDANCVLNGFTITNGYENRGGGIYYENSRSTITNCIIIGNSATWGGGIICRHCCWPLGSPPPPQPPCPPPECNVPGPKIANCIIRSNSADFGGGICCEASMPTITNSTITFNSAVVGAGIVSIQSSPALSNCTIGYNSSEISGGGMTNRDYSFPDIKGCLFIANSAKYAGGMENSYNGSPSLTNCLFSDNWAEYGGGILNFYSNPILTNCILWSDMHGEISGTAVVTYSDVQGGWPGNGNIDADPCFVEPGYWDANDFWIDGDYHLLSDSPCIDAGDPNYVPEPNETDLDGRPRIIGGRIDMGAYEYSPPILAEVRITPRTVSLASSGKWITAFLRLPEEYNVADIDPNSVFLEDEIKPVRFSVDEQSQVATARFTREDVQAILDVGDIELTITGRLNDGTNFEATDTIKVTDKAGKKSVK